jgi:hypothetical protein
MVAITDGVGIEVDFDSTWLLPSSIRTILKSFV